ncbi:hypothetical protein FAZ95_24465 [Trinickia violacea]|uniref:Uncharacterized protein n=1 Tax=Trinickia violacea TaxID=2571746 RepID=A0A4P8IV86_9BURK|nr:hypothetical protein [Trinickia violacea]QCP52336.1 hypothetical protein FAZ95_24465 [Trinickia violacea]
MNAPDSSNSKAPPSLLADAAKGAQANNARILANLEGRVAAQPAPAKKRSKLPFVLAGLLVIAGGGIAAWQVQKVKQTDHALAAVAPAAGDAEQKAAVSANAGSAAQLAAAASAAQKDAASAPHAATIITEDNSDADTKAAPLAGASGVADNRLSRALAEGAEPASGAPPGGAAPGVSTPAVAAAPAIAAAKPVSSAKPSNTAASRAKREAASERHASKVELAHAAKHTETKKVASKNDSDADLLAALVARTPPYSAKKPAVPAAQPGAKAPQASTSLAEQVKDCSTRGFFEDQLCRWRVCDGHWGTDPACPNAAQAKQP